MRNLLILAKWLAGRVDVDVETYEGATACIAFIEGRRVIKIPSAWSYSADPQAAELLEGVIDHEALGHGRFTDLDARSKAEEVGLIKFTNFSASLQNILEDVFIENQAIKAYPGVKANLARTVEILQGRGFFGAPERFVMADPSKLILGGLLNILRARLVPGQADALQVNVDALEMVLPDALGGLWTDVLDIALEVEHSTCTQDNIDLTVRIMALLTTASEQQPDDAVDDEQGSGDPSSGQGDAAEDEGAQPGGEGADSADDEGSSSNGEPSSCPGSAGEEESATMEDAPGDTARFTDKEVKAAREIIDTQDGEMPDTEMGDAIAVAIGKAAMPASKLTHATQVKKISDASKRVCSQVKSISDELQEALLTQVQCVKVTKHEGKRLNSRVLHRVRVGNGRVFMQKHEGEGLSTAVALLVDQSSSMKSPMVDKVHRLDAAIGIAFGLGDMLDEYEVPFQISGYSDAYSTLKSFDACWSKVRKAQAQPDISGNTLTGAAMQVVLGDMVVRPEERKLLVIITDGETADPRVLASCYSEAQEMGIEVASVMIGPPIEAIARLAQQFGFKALSINTSAGLGRYVVGRVLEAI